MTVELNWIYCVWPLSVALSLFVGFRVGVWATKNYLLNELKSELKEMDK